MPRSWPRSMGQLQIHELKSVHGCEAEALSSTAHAAESKELCIYVDGPLRQHARFTPFQPYCLPV